MMNDGPENQIRLHNVAWMWQPLQWLENEVSPICGYHIMLLEA